MSWSEVFLGVIALATLVMAAIQIGVSVGLMRTLRQVQEVITTVREDARPLISRMNAVVDDASRTAALATAQAEKVDRLVTDLARRADDTAAVIQQAIVTPAREGAAIIAGLKAGLAAIREFREMRDRRRQAEEEDPLFIG